MRERSNPITSCTYGAFCDVGYVYNGHLDVLMTCAEGTDHSDIGDDTDTDSAYIKDSQLR